MSLARSSLSHHAESFNTNVKKEQEMCKCVRNVLHGRWKYVVIVQYCKHTHKNTLTLKRKHNTYPPTPTEQIEMVNVAAV